MCDTHFLEAIIRIRGVHRLTTQAGDQRATRLPSWPGVRGVNPLIPRGLRRTGRRFAPNRPGIRRRSRGAERNADRHERLIVTDRLKATVTTLIMVGSGQSDALQVKRSRCGRLMTRKRPVIRTRFPESSTSKRTLPQAARFEIDGNISYSAWIHPLRRRSGSSHWSNTASARRA